MGVSVRFPDNDVHVTVRALADADGADTAVATRAAPVTTTTAANERRKR
jgi:hypothetical protein